jgi:hypothetical protein
MSADSFLLSTPLIDYLRGRVESLSKQRSRGAASRSKGRLPGGAGRANRRPLALVDGLTFRVQTLPERPRRETVLLQERFRDTFVNV